MAMRSDKLSLHTTNEYLYIFLRTHQRVYLGGVRTSSIMNVCNAMQVVK